MPGKKAAQRVDFTGWRYFQRKFGSSVTREELVSFVRRFFSSRRLSFDVVHIKFCQTKEPASLRDGKLAVLMGRRSEGSLVEIYLSTHHTLEDLFDTVAHELDHEAWFLEGREFHSSKPYMARPHEERASATGEKWRKIQSVRTKMRMAPS